MATSKAKKESKPKSKGPSLEKRVTRLEAVVRILERQFGVDLDRDGKVGFARIAALAILAVALSVGIASAATIWQLNQSDGTTSAVAVDDSGNLTVGGAINIGSDGYFDVFNSTQLVFVTSTATNVIDADTSSP